MIIEEEIKRFTDNAEYERTNGNLQGCLEFKQLADWLKELKQLREQEPCEDAVSRKAVVELVEGWWLGHTKEDDLATEVKALPSVTPTRKKGKWIRITQGRIGEIYMCSKCGRTIEEQGIESLVSVRYPFCHCGAEMEVKE